MDTELIREIVKGGVAIILSCGVLWIFYTVVKDDVEQQQFLRDHMTRQTQALEKLVRIYAGDDE